MRNEADRASRLAELTRMATSMGIGAPDAKATAAYALAFEETTGVTVGSGQLRLYAGCVVALREAIRPAMSERPETQS